MSCVLPSTGFALARPLSPSHGRRSRTALVRFDLASMVQLEAGSVLWQYCEAAGKMQLATWYFVAELQLQLPSASASAYRFASASASCMPAALDHATS